MTKLSEEERKEMLRDARAKDELEKATIRLVARKERYIEGFAIGYKEELERILKEGETLDLEKVNKDIVVILYNKGFSKNEIASSMDLDISLVESYLK
jgi:transposase